MLHNLEPRVMPSEIGLAPTVAMLSAMTRDSRSVTIDYRIDPSSPAPAPLRFGVYRSDDPRFDPEDRWVASWTAEAGISPGTARPVDDNGSAADAAGDHRLTIGLSPGLSPDPRKPYVLVVANPDSPGATTDASQTASFRKYTVGIVTHGAMINPSWKNGPPWQLQTARLLEQQGYDAVLPFNWSRQSSKPGRASQQGLRLARQVLQIAAQLPADSPVDVHFIGHSEGTVVNTRAIVTLERSLAPQLSAGYVVDTLLDPHAASNAVPGQVSVSGGLLGSMASSLISGYQSRANDPPVYIPPGVDEAQVFYQHTPSSRYGQIYNLWGQVPVPNLSENPVAYYNLTGAGVIHSGNRGVSLWYRNFVAPTLGDQAPLIQSLRLTGSVETTMSPASDLTSLSAPARRRVQAWGTVVSLASSRPTFTGTAAPDSKIRVYVGPASDPNVIAPGGRTIAGPDGEWSLSLRPLRDGRYRAVAMSYAPALRSRPGLTIVPMAPLGRFRVGDGPRS